MTRPDGIEPRDTTLAIIAATPRVARAMLAGLPQGLLRPSASGEWGPAEVIAHLLDVEGIAFRERMQRIIDEDRPLIPSIDPGGRLAAGGYERLNVGQVLDAFAARRATDVAWLRTLTPQQLERSGQHDKAGAITAGNVFHYWACHDQIHLRQLSKLLQALSEPHLGRTRAFFEEV